MPTFLTTGEHPPHVRLLDWDSGREQSLPAVAGFFDHAIIREGWIALCYNMSAVILGTRPAAATDMRVPGRHPAAHQDPRLVWTTDEAGLARPYDAEGRAAGPAVVVPGGWLTAAFDGAWLQWDPHTPRGTTTHWTAGGQGSELTGWYAHLSSGPFVVVQSRSSQDMGIFDLRDGSMRLVPRPHIHRWGILMSLSPDGRHVAVSAALHDETPVPADVPSAERDNWRYRHFHELVHERLQVIVVIDVLAASCMVAEGTFDNFASPPAWSADSSSFVFGVPFEPRATIGAVQLADMRVELRRFPEGTGTPAVDATGVFDP